MIQTNITFIAVLRRNSIMFALAHYGVFVWAFAAALEIDEVVGD